MNKQSDRRHFVEMWRKRGSEKAEEAKRATTDSETGPSVAHSSARARSSSISSILRPTDRVEKSANERAIERADVRAVKGKESLLVLGIWACKMDFYA